MSAAALQSVSATRARVCAIVATNVLRTLFDRQLSDETKTYSDALLPMARLLIGSFNPFQGAPLAVIDKVRAWKGEACRTAVQQGAEPGRTGKGQTRSSTTRTASRAPWSSRFCPRARTSSNRALPLTSDPLTHSAPPCNWSSMCALRMLGGELTAAGDMARSPCLQPFVLDRCVADREHR